MLFFKLYLLSFVIFFGLDLFWLGIVAKNLYRQQIGFLMADQISWVPAILFYGLFLIGLVFFAIAPAVNEGSWISALLTGCLFGLICYATYDLTNLATLNGWPLKIVIYDLLWGTFISGTTALLTYLIAMHWKASF